MRHLRAALIALHLLAISMMAFPSASGGMNRAAWKDPTVQEEFSAWTARLQAFGWSGDSQQLQDQAWTLVSAYEKSRKRALDPFYPYFRYCGTWQSWRMFVAPHRYPSRLHIDLEEDGAWRPIYIARSGEHVWRGHQLDHDRFRSAIFRYAWPNYRGAYSQFGRWVQRQSKEDFPNASRVRVRFYKYRTPSPEEVLTEREPKGRFENARVYPL